MGLGYIGLPTAIIAAKHGIQITGVDINPQVVDMTNAGHLHIIEPGMEEMLQEVVNAGSLKASIKPEVSDAYFMVVPTPFKGNHEPDVSYVEAAYTCRIAIIKGRRPLCHRVHFTRRHHRSDGPPHFQRTS